MHTATVASLLLGELRPVDSLGRLSRAVVPSCFGARSATFTAVPRATSFTVQGNRRHAAPLRAGSCSIPLSQLVAKKAGCACHNHSNAPQAPQFRCKRCLGQRSDIAQAKQGKLTGLCREPGSQCSYAEIRLAQPQECEK